MEPQEASVSGWLSQLQKGNVDRPVQELWERYFQRLMGLAKAKLGKLPKRVADEEDVALSAFDSFCQGVARGRFPQLNDRNDLWRVLVTITARKALNLNRRHGRQKRGGNATLDQAALAQIADDSQAMGLEQFLSREPTPEFVAQATEEYERLIAFLPDPDLRQIAQWKMEGFTNEEIAARLHCVSRSIERKLQIIRTMWDLVEEKD
jgi:DNA-directed RNA polymerase specialized sigma24 family protein